MTSARATFGFLGGLLIVATVWATGCGGAVDPNTGGSPGPTPGPTTTPPSPRPDPVGPNACVPGSYKKQGDGCNTCACANDGTWNCTLTDCEPYDASPPPAECKEGDKKQIDACNSCVCAGGNWECTGTFCADASPPSFVCPGPRPPTNGQPCAAILVWAKDPLNGDCCAYKTTCSAPQGWKQFMSETSCKN